MGAMKVSRETQIVTHTDIDVIIIETNEVRRCLQILCFTRVEEEIFYTPFVVQISSRKFRRFVTNSYLNLKD